MLPIRRLGGALAAVLISGNFSLARANSLPEVEVNHPISSAQPLRSSNTDIEIAAALSGAVDGGDVDFYLVYVNSGGVLTVDIDEGFTGFGRPESVNTVLAIFGPGPEYDLLRTNDNAIVDPGSVYTFDARIEDFVAPATGTYVVAVSSSPRFFLNGGSVLGSPIIDNGTYVLKISGVSPAVRQIAIEIKPGNKRIYPVNPTSKGKLPVALLGSADFNAMNVDQASLTFGSTGDEDSLHKCLWHGKDVNRDGNLDLVCHFYTERAAFEMTDLEGVLKGVTKKGEAFEGRATLKVVPLVNSPDGS